MKKIISILVAIVMVLSTVSAFAIETPAISVDVDSSGSSVYCTKDLNSIAEGTGSSDGNSHPTILSNTGFGANKDHPLNFEFKNGALVMQRPEGATKSGLVYINYPLIVNDGYVFGYDVKFDNVTKTSEFGGVLANQPGAGTTDFDDSVQARIDSGELTVGEGSDNNKAYDAEGNVKAYKTAWRFYSQTESAPHLTFSAKFEEPEEVPEEEGELSEVTDEEITEPEAPAYIVDENGKLVIFHGDAQLIQGETYTFRVYVKNGKYNSVIIDKDGNVQQGISGYTQKAFTSFTKIDTSLQPSLNDGASATIDNIFSGKYFTLAAQPSYNLDSTGAIKFGINIPAGMTDVKAYIGGEFIGDIEPQAGATDYFVTAKLPEGTQFGKTEIKVVGTLFGEEVTSAYETDITKYYAGASRVIDTPTSAASPAGLRRIASPADPVVINGADGNPSHWAVKNGEIDIATLNPVMKGIVEFSFDINTPNLINQLRLRMTSSTVKGNGLNWYGSTDNTTDPYKYFINGHPQNTLIKKNEWNKFLIHVDYYAHTFKAYINGELIEESFFTDEDGVTDQVQDVRLIINSSESNPIFYLDNFKFEEIKTVTAPPVITYNYNDGSVVNYDGGALSAVNLASVNFALATTLENITAENTKVFDSTGNEADGFAVSFADDTVSVSYTDGVAPDGDYKLVIGESATLNGTAIGSKISYDFAFLSESVILAPAENSSVSGLTTLSAYVSKADKVAFYVNDEFVSEFDPEADAVYETEYTAKEMGAKVFDVYAYTSEGVEITSTTFSTIEATETLGQNNACESGPYTGSAATGEFVEGSHDGTKAFKMTSKVGTLVNDAINKDTSNSNTSSFGPGNNLYRVKYTEFEIKPGANTNVTTEIGYSLSGETYAANTGAYRTLYLRGSQPALFNGKTNTILGTQTTYTPETWYKVSQFVDFNNMICQWNVWADNDTNPDYETLVLTTKDDISGLVSGDNAKSFPNWKENIVITYKYKICISPSDFVPTSTEPVSIPATATIDNFRRYQPENLPEFKDVESNIIEAGTDELTFALTKAYDFADGDVNSLVAENIEVYVNGEEFAATAEIIDGANFKVSGLAGVKAGSAIDIKVSDAAFFNGNLIGKYLTQRFYVVDDNGLCVLPLNRDANNGGKFGAKYINLGGSVEAYLSLAKLDGLKLAGASFETITFEGGITGYVASKDACDSAAKLRLWTKGLAPIAPQATFEAIAE